MPSFILNTLASAVNSVYVALYVVSPVTVAISGFHPANAYIVPSTGSFVGVAPLNIGVAPYNTFSSFSNSVLSSSTQITVYLFLA